MRIQVGACLFFAACGVSLAEETPTTARLAFGFRTVEIFKVDHDSLGLTVTDLNGDALPDLVVANNAEATLHLLLQRKPGEKEPEDGKVQVASTSLSLKPPSLKPSLNEIKSDPRFRVEKFYTEKHVSSLAVGDFNGDKRPDLAYYSDPPELELVLQAETWGANRQKFPIRDGSQSPYALSVGDVNVDGRDDLVLLGKGKTYIFYQEAAGRLRQPLIINSSVADLWDAEIADLNGDGRPDLISIIPNAEEPFLVRLQGETGFGPEVGARLRPIQSWWVASFPPEAAAKPEKGAKPVPTLFTVQDNTHRVKAYRWKEKPAKSGLTAPHLLALRAEGDARQCGRLFADVNHDGRTDVVVSYPETAQLEVHFQDGKGNLSRSASYPTLAGVNAIAAADVDGDGRQEILVTSPREKALGVSRWQDDRLQLPSTSPLESVPLLLAAGPLRQEAVPLRQEAGPLRQGAVTVKDRVFLVLRTEDNKYQCSVLSLSEKDAPRVEAKLDLSAKGGEPKDIRLLDADGDGATDFLVFIAYEEPHLYRQAAPASGAEGTGAEKAGAEDADPGKAAATPRVASEMVLFEDISRKPGFGLGQLSKELEPVALTVARLGFGTSAGSAGAPAAGPAGNPSDLLVAAKSYVRVLRLDKDGRLQVVEQLSGRGASASLVASVPLNIDDDPEKEIVALDASSSSLEVFQRGAGGNYELAESVEIPKFDLMGMDARDMDGDGREDLILLAKEKIGILYSRPRQEGLEEVWTYTLEKKDDLGSPQDIASGDLNGDGVPDLVVSTTPRYNLLLLTSEEKSGGDGAPKALSMKLALAFPIFEEKTFMARRTTFGPRQMLSEDIDKDGLEDLLLLIHDRILLYLQDATP